MAPNELEQRLARLVNAPLDRKGLEASFDGMLGILIPLRGDPQYERLATFVYERVLRVFNTDNVAASLFYRADYMLALLGRVIEGESTERIITVPDDIITKIKQSFYAMKERYKCEENLPYEEDLERL